MSSEEKIPATIDEYIAGFPENVQIIMEQLRQTIREAAPEATEKISWAMPTFFLKKNLVHFAGHKKHIGFYPGDTGVSAFIDELSEYKTSKGGIQLPLDKPLPIDLIIKIVKFRIEENLR